MLLDAESLKDAEHLSEAVVGLAQIRPLDAPISSHLLRLVDAIHFFNLGC